MKRAWTYLVNPFLSLLNRSRTKALQASKYTCAQLEARSADAFFGPLFAFYKPFNDAFVDEQADWDAQKGQQKGSTTTVDNLLSTLSSDKIEIWDIAVQGQFRKGTPEYIAIFPQGRKLFQQGKKNDRIEAVKALGLALTGIVPLSTTKTDVDDFYQTISTARNQQTGNIGDTSTDSDDVTAAATNAMNSLYEILGKCIAQFSTTPLSIEPLFDLSILRDSEQTEFTRTLSPQEVMFIAKRSLEPSDIIRLKVNTIKPVKFFIAEEKNDINPTIFFEVNGTEEQTVNASQLGNVPEAKFLKAVNVDDGVEAKIELELL